MLPPAVTADSSARFASTGFVYGFFIGDIPNLATT
jgi:hypothetical protein